MAADQHRKCRTSSTFFDCTSREQCKPKKKKLDLAQDDLNVRSNIGLEWDYQSSSVVAKKEQVSICRRDLIAFSDAVPNCYGNLSDVFTVPGELFELDNLVDILSYEVWFTHLSENERNILMRFLPDGAEPDNIIQKLLSGDNFHFGNLFHRWGTAVCSGKLHPDHVLYREQQVKASKAAYYSHLHKYHNDMIENLQIWKTRWNGCKGHLDPDEESLYKLGRTRKQLEKSMKLSETLYCDREEKQVDMLDSSSLGTYGKSCRTDGSPTLSSVPRKGQKRKGFSVRVSDSSPDVLEDVGKIKRVERLDKYHIQHCDGAQYMSYIKVSKEQHQRVKSTMRQICSSSQPRPLNTILGNLDSLLVQPLEIFEEEEKQKLHDYWLKLANRDIPDGFADWSNRKLEACKLVKSLGQEIEGRMKFQGEDEGVDSCPDMSTELMINNKEVDYAPLDLLEQGEERENSGALLEDQMPCQFKKDEVIIDLEDESEKQPDCILQGQAHEIGDVDDDHESGSISTEEEHLTKISLITSDDQGKCMDMYSHHENLIAKTNHYSPFATDYSENANHGDIPVRQEDICLSADNVWSAVSVPGSYSHSDSASHGYVSSSELSLPQAQVEEQPTRGIGVEMATNGKASSKDFLTGQSMDLSLYTYYPIQGQNGEQEKDAGGDIMLRRPDDASLTSAFPTREGNELFDPFFRSQSGLPYHHEQKRIGLDFQQSDNQVVGTSQLSGIFNGQVNGSYSLDTSERIINDLYVDQAIQETVYSEEGRYSSAKQLAINMQGWGASSGGILTPPLSSQNGGDLARQNWILGDNQDRGSWSGTEGGFGPSRGIGTKSNCDQSLFSVVSQCQELRSVAPRVSVGPSDHSLHSGAYSALREGVSATSNTLQHNANSLNYLSEHEGMMGFKVNNNSGWVGVLHHNSGLQDPISKMFLKSWNQ